jgi:hypothetical protein
MERIQPSDAEGKGSVGNFINTRNSWTETNGMLMAMELPGIYLQTDRDKIYVFDAVESRIVKRTKEGIVISIINPTRYDAKISLFAETVAESKKPLGYTAFLKWPKVEVKAGTTRLFLVSNNGKAITQY